MTWSLWPSDPECKHGHNIDGQEPGKADIILLEIIAMKHSICVFAGPSCILLDGHHVFRRAASSSSTSSKQMQHKVELDLSQLRPLTLWGPSNVSSKFFSGVGAPILDWLLIYLVSKNTNLWFLLFFPIIKFLITSGAESLNKAYNPGNLHTTDSRGVSHTITPFLAQTCIFCNKFYHVGVKGLF